ncbi:MAG TPA: metallopeptidase TldD-related protein [Acidimicrobiales bacterium]|nr:metallopeptidase TldD-related protein [Acidimicrobiales bacterium]
MTVTTPQELVERALALSTADGCLVIADESSDANVRWANNTVTTNGVTRSRQLTVIATIGQGRGVAAGSVSRAGVSTDRLEDLVRAAEKAARSSMPAEDAQPLVAPGPGTGTDTGAGAPGGAWDAAPQETSIAAFSAFIPSLGHAFEQARGGDRLLFGFAQHHLQTTYLGSSTGLRLRHDQPMGTVELNAKSSDFRRSAWFGQSASDLAAVDVPALDGELGERLGWAARQVELPAGRYETILPPSSVADLMIDLYWSAGARDAHEGRTVFSRPGGGTRVGETLSPLPITLRSDPGAEGLACAPFAIAYASSSMASVFDNGWPLQPTRWVDEGRLAALLQSRYSARLTGLPVTPPIDNLIMEAPGSTATVRQMAETTERGLLLTSLWYIREVDPQTLLLTGLTRDGVYLVEGGEVVGAVNNFRFNESPVDLLRRATEVGGTEVTLSREWGDYFSRTAMPPLRVPDFNMSSVSQAT